MYTVLQYRFAVISEAPSNFLDLCATSFELPSYMSTMIRGVVIYAARGRIEGPDIGPHPLCLKRVPNKKMTPISIRGERGQRPSWTLLPLFRRHAPDYDIDTECPKFYRNSQ